MGKAVLFLSPLQQSTFVRAGEQAHLVKRTPVGTLSTRDWQLLVDLKQHLKFLSHIAATSFRLDIVLASEATKQAVVSWKDGLEDAFETTLSKYAGLVSNCPQAKWRVP